MDGVFAVGDVVGGLLAHAIALGHERPGRRRLVARRVLPGRAQEQVPASGRMRPVPTRPCSPAESC